MSHPNDALLITRLGEQIDLLLLHDLNPERYPFFLHSASEGNQNTRYDILFAFPGETLSLNQQGLCGRDKAVSQSPENDFLRHLDQWFAEEQCALSSELPFSGGWFVYLGYELAGQVEPTLKLPQAEDQPTAFACRVRTALITDKQTGQTLLVQEADLSAAEQQAQLEFVRTDLAAAAGQTLVDGSIAVEQLQEHDPDIYRGWIARVLSYIHDGDIFQANLSRPWRARLKEAVPTSHIFAELRRQNPSPFAACVHYPGMDIISSSPERLVSVRNGVAETRPIAGTRPRLPRADDVEVTRELLGHPKERSEHIMLIDLERNDLGRVCQPGTVEVDELMVLESYAHVHHIVSNVRGRLREGILPGETLRAVFPGGTITGCPKVRCMEILAELEQEARGPYTGSLGYINRNGDMDFNILIRTIVRQGEQLTLRAGGGIVADSDVEKELEETRAKARGMLKVFARENAR